jgi:hypothetical protein
MLRLYNHGVPLDISHKADICIITLKQLAQILRNANYSLDINLILLDVIQPDIWFEEIPEYFKRIDILEKTCFELYHIYKDIDTLSEIFLYCKPILEGIEEVFGEIPIREIGYFTSKL